MSLLSSNAIDWSRPVNQSCRLNVGLLNWWLMRGPKSGGLTLFDLCERNNGTLTSGPTWDTTNGRNSIKFDGTDDYIQTTVSRSLTAATFSCWAYITTRKAWQGIVYSRGTSVTGISLDPGATKLGYVWNNDVNTWNWTGGPTLPASEWVYLAVTVASSSAVAYVWSQSNGMQSATNSVSHTSTTVDDLKFGQDDFDPSNRGVVGNLDDIRLYDRTLSSDEISELCYDSRTGYGRTLNRINSITNYFRGWDPEYTTSSKARGIVRSNTDAIDWAQPVNQSCVLNRGLLDWWVSWGPKAGGLTLFDLCERSNGTLTNGPTWESTNARKSIKFDGTDDHVQTTGSRSLTTATFSCWAYITTRKAYQGIVFSRGTNTTGMHVGSGATTLAYTWNDAFNTYSWTGGPTIPASEWVFLCVSVSGSSATAYVWSAANGLLSATNSVSHTSTTVDDLKFGQDDFDPSNRGVVGNLDDIRLYDRALSSDEVAALCYDSRTGYRRTLNRLQRAIGWSTNPLVWHLKCQDFGSQSKLVTDSSDSALSATLANTYTIDLATVSAGPGGSLRRCFDGSLFAINEESFTNPFGYTYGFEYPECAFGVALNIQSLTDTIGLICDSGIMFGVRIESGVLYILGDSDGETGVQTITLPLTTGWHHLGINFYTDGYAAVFWDGAALGSVDGPSISFLELSYIGLDGYSLNRFNVPFCDIRLYNGTRTEAEWYDDAQYGDIPTLHLNMQCQDDLTLGPASDQSVYGHYAGVSFPNVDYMSTGTGSLSVSYNLAEFAANGDALILDQPFLLDRFDAWTLQFFAKRSSTNGSVTIIGDSGLGSYPAATVAIDGNYLYFQSSDYSDVGAGTLLNISTVNNSAWHHFALVGVQGGTIYLYVDGSYFTASTTLREKMWFDSFGGSNAIATGDGFICGIKLYTEARTSAQILADANYGGLPALGAFIPSRLRRSRTIYRM